MPRENTKIAIRALNSLYEVVMDIYKNTDWNIISIDKCTAYTKEVNVLVLEDNFI